MKAIRILLIWCALLPASLSAQTLHAIIFANTKCPGDRPGQMGIGPSVTVDFQRMGLELTTISKSIGYQLKKYYYYDTPDRFCRSSLDNVLNNLTCAPNDIVYFYYSGHGGRAENEKSDFPEMVLKVSGSVSPYDLYPIHDVYKRIRAKSPRLTIVMGDLCNSVVEGYYRKENRQKGATVLTKDVCNAYKNLFLNAKGGLIATSSGPGETSQCYVPKIEGKYYDAGGYFTHTFLSLLQYCVEKDKDVSWEVLMDNVVEYTHQLAIENGEENPQKPIYLPELTQANEAPVTTSPSVPQAPTQTDDAASNLQDNLAFAMSKVGNMNVSLSDRIRNIQPAKKYFSQTAKVQVVGCDNSTIVNTSSAESYLNYLSMATTIDQVVMLDMKKDENGKIIYARVHEIHFK